MFYRTGVIADGSLHCGNSDFFYLFRSCDLDLDSMTFIYVLDLYILEICRMCKYELTTLRLSKFILIQQRDSQSGRKLYTTLLLGWSVIKIG